MVEERKEGRRKHRHQKLSHREKRTYSESPPDSNVVEDTKIKMSWNQSLETSRAVKKQGL